MLKSIKDQYSFRIEKEIAQGGMGTVYRATQLGAHGFEKQVAIKTILPHLCKNPHFIDMFISEGKLVADLVHENIVQIYQLSNYKDGCYIVMEYVHGLSLHDFLHFHTATGIPLEKTLAVFIVSRIARALAYAHSRLDAHGNQINIVHRDVCPNNILITTEGLPKLGDFGIAKAANNILVANERALIGKLLYMSPEQARREPVDHRSDIYSLGMVLFELLTSHKAREPWVNNALSAASEGCIAWQFMPDDVDDELIAILKKMLALEPGQRYARTDEVGYALELYIYRDGYGPTVVTLENYLRQNFSYLYEHQQKSKKNQKIDQTIRMED